MASIRYDALPNQLINRKLVNFAPPEYERIKETLVRRIDVVARSFCESRWTMLHAINCGDARIGTISDDEGSFCIYIEYLGIQVLKPVHLLH